MCTKCRKLEEKMYLLEEKLRVMTSFNITLLTEDPKDLEKQRAAEECFFKV
jgi:hypothetical protein